MIIAPSRRPIPKNSSSGAGPRNVTSKPGISRYDESVAGTSATIKNGATDPQLKRDVAVKILPREFSGDPERVRRFEQEAYAVSALKHPNIVTIYEVGEHRQLHFIVTELIEGQTLRHQLAQGPLGWRAAVRLASQIAAGLSIAHAAGIIHRDIKPENIVVQADGHAKVLDFGIAKWVQSPTDGGSNDAAARVQTRLGATPGTLKYMSPEQVAGKSLDQRTDVFSLGLILYEMIVGFHPYWDQSDDGLIAALKGRGEIPPISHSIPAALDRILRCALRKNPAERYPAASQMSIELDELKSLIEVSRQEAGQSLLRASNANQLMTQFAVLYNADPDTRMPLGALWTIWRFADLKRGKLERQVIRNSLLSSLMRITLLMLVVAATTTGLAALKSISEVWDERVMRDGHTAAVRRAVFSPDGRLLVSASEDHQVIVWDFMSRQRLKTLTDHTGPILTVAFSPDGRWFATGSDDKSVIVWDAARLEKMFVLREHQAPVRAIAFSSDGRLMVSASYSAIIWETGSWKKAREVPFEVTYGNLVFLAGNRWLADSLGRIWDVSTGELVRHSDAIHGNWTAISPDHRHRVTIASNGTVKFVDPRQQKLLSIQRAHDDHGRSVTFSPDGKLIATAAERVLLWDAATLTRIVPLEYESIVWSVDFSPDGKSLVSTHGDGAILVWDAANRERVANLREHSGGVRAVAFSPDGKRVASASDDQSVVVWNVESGQKEAVLVGHHTRVTAVTFSPDNQWLASADQDGIVIRWNLQQRLSESTMKPFAEDRPSYCVTISPNGRWIATNHSVYDATSGSRVMSLAGAPGGNIYGAAFTPDGRRLVCVTDGGYVVLWDTQTWQLLEQQRWAETPLVTLSLSRDGRYLTTGEDGKNVRFGTIEPLAQVAVLGRHEARVKSVAFSPDGATVASAGDDKTIALWNVSRRKLITRIGTHTSPVYALAFSPDGQRLISGEHDRSVRIYTRRRTLWGFELD
jgi:WD40 repeat protein